MSKYFNQEKFKEIIDGLKACCELNPEMLLKSATEIYLNASAEVGESVWKVTGNGCTIKVTNIVQCQACGHQRARFIADTLDYCPACGKSMRMK